MSFHCWKQPFASVLQLFLSFAILVHAAPCCPTMSSLQRHFGLPTDLTPFYLPVCASNSPPIIFHSGDIPSSLPSRIGYILVLCLMIVLRIPFFTLTIIFLSIARWLASSFFINAFARDHVWHLYVISGKAHWLKTFLFRLMERCLSRKISLYWGMKLTQTLCYVHSRLINRVLFQTLLT